MTSSQNAVRHGLRAERLQLTDEERNSAAALRHGLAGRWMPVDEVERSVVEAMVVVEIKLARLDGVEMRVLDSAMADQQPEGVRLPSLSTLDRYRGRLMRERRELDERFEMLKAMRSQLVGKSPMSPEALRYLADLAEHKAARQALSSAKIDAGRPANDDSCTNKPDNGLARGKPEAGASKIQ